MQCAEAPYVLQNELRERDGIRAQDSHYLTSKYEAESVI